MIENYNPIVKKNNVLAPFWDNALTHKNASTDEIASFQDSAVDFPIRELSAEINPVQNLHGYDNPWPGGGGKNLFDRDNTDTITDFYIEASTGKATIGKNIGVRCVIVPCKPNTTYTTSCDITTTLRIASYSTRPTNGQSAGAFVAPSGKTTAGNGLTITTTSNDVCIAVQTIANDDISAGTSFEMVIHSLMIVEGANVLQWSPYSNICPISGYTTANVTRCGKNFFDEKSADWVYGRYIDSSDSIVVTANYKYTRNYIFVKPNTTYTLQCIKTIDVSRAISVCEYDESHNIVYRTVIVNTTSTTGLKSGTFTTTSTTKYIRVNAPYSSDDYEGSYHFQLEFGSTATEFEEYRGNTYTISFPSDAGTVYSGTLTKNPDGTGTLVVDKVFFALNTAQWAYVGASGSERFYSGALLDLALYPTTASSVPNLICTKYRTVAQSVYLSYDDVITLTTTGSLVVRDTSYTDVTSFVESLSDANIVYKLATPITYTIPANQIECITSMSGLNIVWINTGDITSLVYYADNQAFNDEMEKKVDTLEKYVNANTITDTASGAIATFSDGAEGVPIKSLSVAIEPVQDLHGYDNPWPDGGGKNLFDNDGEYLNGKFISSTGAIRDSTGTPLQRLYEQKISVNPNENITVSSVSTEAAIIRIAEYTQNEEFIRRVLTSDTTNPTVTITTSENTSYILINPDETCSNIQVEKGTTATTFATYSNICPISGHTECNVTRTGKNLLNDAVMVEGTNFDENGNIITNSSYRTLQEYIPVTPSTTYSLQMTKNISGTRGFNVCFYDANRQFISRNNYILSSSTGLLTGTFTTTANTFFIRCGAPISGDTSNLMIEEGATATNYEPFGTTYPITFPSGTTVYGGNITVNQDGSGSLVVDKAFLALSTAQWAYDGTSGSERFYSGALLNLALYPTTASSVPDLICTKYRTVVQSAYSSNDDVITLTTTGSLVIRDTSYTDVTSFVESLSDANVVYKLATPITIPLTAPQITTLLGRNNLWADCNGDVSVTYRADTAMYIAKKIAEALA